MSISEAVLFAVRSQIVHQNMVLILKKLNPLIELTAFIKSSFVGEYTRLPATGNQFTSDFSLEINAFF